MMENNEIQKSKRLSNFLKKNLSSIIGIILGVISGYLYYRTIGCSSGSCPITSNVWMSMGWGAAMGYLIAGMFRSGGCGCKYDNNLTCNKNEN